MKELFDACEAALIWGTVIFALGLVSYLAYQQYRKAKRRRAHRRHRARRASKQSDGTMGEQQASHNHQG